MCGRYILVQKIEIIEKRFNVIAPNDFVLTPSYNISPGNFAPIITSENPKSITISQFGMTPHWATKPMYLFNARAEGDKNLDNNSDYSGSKDIILKPAFRKPIRSQRCLVIADAFIEGTTKSGLNNPYLVFLKNKERPFAFAGIYDQWKNPTTGENIHAFSIITTAANELVSRIPHHRSPVILRRESEQKWLSGKTSLSDITKLLHPYKSELMDAYPITSRVKDSKENDKDLITPLGNNLSSISYIKRSESIELQGMGNRKKPQQ